jgi:transposase
MKGTRKKHNAAFKAKVALDGAARVFDGGGAAEGGASEAQVDVLYRQIGQLKVENDFLARKLGK